jgi:hypothetical protein
MGLCSLPKSVCQVFGGVSREDLISLFLIDGARGKILATCRRTFTTILWNVDDSNGHYKHCRPCARFVYSATCSLQNGIYPNLSPSSLNVTICDGHVPLPLKLQILVLPRFAT